MGQRKAILRFLMIIALLLMGSANVNFNTAESKEKIVFLSGIQDHSSAIKQMKVLITDTGDVHLFCRLVNSTGDKLFHLYHYNGESHLDVIEDYAAGVELYDLSSSFGSVTLVYGITTGLGAKIIRSYTWTSEHSYYKDIVQLSANLLYYITFFKVINYEGVIHIFYTYIYGDNAEFTNVTHIYGITIFTTEQFSLNGPFTMKMRNTLDITIAPDSSIWYWYRLFNNDTTVGVGLLANETLIPLAQYYFLGLQNPISNLQAFYTLDSSFNVTAIFVEPRKLIVLNYNNYTLTSEIHELPYNSPTVLDYFVQGNDSFCLLSDVADITTNYTSIYYGSSKQAKEWLFKPVTHTFPIGVSNFTTYLFGETYAVSYYSVVDPNNYAPTGIRYKESQAIGLFVISETSLNFEIHITNLSSFSPLTELFINNWRWFVVSGIVFVILIVAFAVFWKRNGKQILEFLFDPRVGPNLSKFIRMWKNIGRYFYNRFSLIFTLFTSNKKRTFFTILGFLLTGYLLSSAIIIAQSEESAMIKAYYRTNPLISNDILSAQLTTSFYGSTNSTAQYDQLVKEQLIKIHEGKLTGRYLSYIKSAYYSSIKLSSIYSGSLVVNYKFVGLPDDTSEYFESILTEGRKPTQPLEIALNGKIARRFGLQINDTIAVFMQETSSAPYYPLNLTITGFFEQLNVAQIRKISAYLDEPNDLYTILSVADFITTNSLYFQILSGLANADLKIHGMYQFYFDFSKFVVNDIATLIEEQRQIKYSSLTLPFDEYGQLTITEELFDFFSNFNQYYFNNLARLLIFAIPAILMAIFMIIESSELFATSYQNEIEILRTRGIKNRRIARIYIFTRLLEIIFATVAGYGIAVLTAIPLIKVNGFISFRNTDTHLVIENVLLEMGLVALVLFLISLPRILVIVNRKKTVEKEPNKIIKALKTISWRELFFLLLGLILLIYFYNETFRAYYENHSTNFVLYLNLTIIGAIFALLGALPIFIQLLGGVWKVIGFLSWRAKKTKTSFIFAEISRDIKYFQNITLIFLIISVILIPVFVVPYSKEHTLSEQAHFINGSDLRIRDWSKVTNITEEEIQSVTGVTSTTYAKLYMLYLGIFESVRILVINTTTFADTFYKPNPQISNVKWPQLKSLKNDTILISETIEEDYFKTVGETFDLKNPDFPDLTASLEIVGKFDLFPAFFFEEDAEEAAYLIVMSFECFESIKNVITRRMLLEEGLYIRASSETAIPRIKKAIFKIDPHIVMDSYIDIKDSLKTPLYNILIIELILSLFVAVAVLVFSSITTSIKILEKRVIKHDIMKKIGIKVSEIIRFSAIQVVLGALLPALIAGIGSGIAIIPTVLNLLNYGVAPYPQTIQYPWVALAIIVLGIPIAVWFGMNYIIGREFHKYAPTQME